MEGGEGGSEGEGSSGTCVQQGHCRTANAPAPGPGPGLHSRGSDRDPASMAVRRKEDLFFYYFLTLKAFLEPPEIVITIRGLL